ncbi:aspartate/glutamate racemase family protein [Myroides sp. 1354]|uniref:aspartate/glutamate racemase family protein n=1 Tax=unclassified Myroides TaxID=2642485 RepID=UPI0025778C6F|nr:MULTISPECIES: aspartate/glutamate racemase family protein [unclassified Myroides]MDM1044837.1 aspartate/glutamate racemase family protein [Myroides sp. R163-1]MDM1055550.1 aspartate/glutamate racemase family protein [Myroides sp. 1354]MDM1068847.1 aspartate/glutamate racemase family protein [Myroides sp. 1372]
MNPINKILGILDGMEPRSTTPFLELVLDECQSQYNAVLDEEFPEIILYSLPTPFYLDRDIDHQLMQKTIVKGLQKLEANGVHSIAMPCNSAHIYIDSLQNSIDTKLFNMVEETLNELPMKQTRTTLFATSTTYDAQIYQKGLEEKGHVFIFEPAWQLELNTIIAGIKKDKTNPQNQLLWEQLIHKVKPKVEAILIACTDLNAVIQSVPNEIILIDSSKSLAKAFIKDYLK